MATSMALQNFATLLRQKNYKPSTIQLYLTKLRHAGVDLENGVGVHDIVRRHIFGDLHGHTYRSLRLFDRFVNNLPIRVMPPTKPRSALSKQQACLKMKSRLAVKQAWWLMQRGYAPSTAVFYMKSQNRLDFNKNGRRARIALQEYVHEPSSVIDDPVVLEHYRNLSV